MFKPRKNKIKSGWEAQKKEQKQENFVTVDSSQIIKSKKNNSVFEKIIKWIIFAILFIAIPRYLKSSRLKGKEIVNTTYDKLNSNEFAFVPAGYAMYLFLSFVPIICLVLGIISSINIKYETVLKLIILGQIIPGIGEIIPSISTLWNTAGGAIAFLLFAFSVLWLSSKGYAKFIDSIDALYGYKSPNRLWKTRIKGFITSLILAFGLMVLLLGLTAFTTFVIENANLGVFLKDLSKMTLADFKLGWEFYLIFWFSIIILLPVLTYLTFLVYFKFAPSFKLKFSHVNSGALIASIPTSIFILIFGSLASLIPYKKFGVVATFMYVILLLSIMGYFIYAGAIVNSSFYNTFIKLPIAEKSSWFKNKKIRI
ncbi:YhjD/YihY/BrkB family envelope integrity protein [Mycoplasma struthionis]|uniref:YihY/virulence factor BrkB family protein n=1 Tax=Mycoplasma struthionis TaxID=538220 RepID=A0A3G8LGN2_9MOLU|nr:YhjD/YihY/BrkB family envelope integrity protein [Mycoplasma struthionis]AZG68671.1 YihY/virulence factor BrkB family protein [Mycoplasma struthionis]